MPICPHCGQQVVTKFGIKFQPMKAAMLDMIEVVTQRRGGIEGKVLGWTFFPGVSTTKQMQRVHAHVNQINEMLVSTDWRIINTRAYRHGGAFYKLASSNDAEKNVA